MKQSFTANAGEIVSFDWNFLTTADNVNSTFFNDYAFVTIVPVSSAGKPPVKLADTFNAFHPSTSSLFDMETGFQTYTFRVSQTSEYLIGVGIVDVNDATMASGIVVDNFTITPSSVPEPTSMIPLGIGIVSLASYAGYRQWPSVGH